MQLLQASTERDRTKTFSLEHTIRSMSEDHDEIEEVDLKGNLELGLEVQPPNGGEEELGQYVVQRVDSADKSCDSKGAGAGGGRSKKAAVPYQRFS